MAVTIKSSGAAAGRLRVGAVILILASHFVLLGLLFTPFRFQMGTGNVVRGLDIPAIHQAGERARRGDAIYWPVRKTREEGPPPYRYLPPSAYTVSVLLSLLPVGAAKVTWLVLVELMVLANAALLMRHCRSLMALGVGLAMWLLLPPVFVDLWFGQFSVAAASAVFWACLVWGLHRRGPVTVSTGGRRLALACWLMAGVLKSMPALLALAFCKHRVARAAIPGVLGLLAISTVVYFALRPEDLSLFMLINADAHEAWLSPWNGGLWGALAWQTYELPPEQRRAIAGTLLAVVAGVASVATVRAREDRVVWLIGVWICAFFLVFKEVWDHQYAFLYPVVTLLAMQQWDERPREETGPAYWETVSVMLAILLTVWVCWPNPFITLDGEYYTDLIPGLIWRPLPIVLLFVLCVISSLRRFGSESADGAERTTVAVA